MPILETDPLAQGGLAAFAEGFRKGATTSEQATRAYLSRIEALNGRLGAFLHVAAEQAMVSARAIDALRAAGTYLGPLMGVPIGVKDLFAVEGMPTTAGSKLKLDDIIGAEGPLVKSLRRAGCIILGKTNTVEFALGITGVSAPQGTPLNPWDADTPRAPGGSSSGSGVATAAGLCAFAIGSDTGGSVRVPAALCGIFGLKTTPGLLSNAGAFPLAPHIDTPGFLARSAEDAAIIWSEIMGLPAIGPAPLASLRFGVPRDYFFDDLDPAVARRVEEAITTLQRAGARIETIGVPEAPEREAYFRAVLPACLVATLGRERFLAGRDDMDPIVAKRGMSGLDVTAVDYLALEARRRRSRTSAAARFRGLDAWLAPTTAITPPPLSEFEDERRAYDLALGMTRNTQPANYLGLPAVSIPLPAEGGELPVGLQVICPEGADSQALSIALAIESVVGKARLPEAARFL